MTTFISIRELDIVKHMSDEYAIINIYFFEKNKNDNSVIAKITREVYLINNLKINMLINNDCINLKKIIINKAKDTTYIDSCDVIIAADIRTSRIIVQISMQA